MQYFIYTLEQFFHSYLTKKKKKNWNFWKFYLSFPKLFQLSVIEKKQLKKIYCEWFALQQLIQ